MKHRFGILLMASAMGVAAQTAQPPVGQLQKHQAPAAEEEAQSRAAAAAANLVVTLDIVVRPKSGNGLAPEIKQADLTLLDDRKPATLTQFKAIHPGEEPQRVLLVLDFGSLPPDSVGTIRERVDQFLHQKNVTLPVPTALAIVGQGGLKVSPYTKSLTDLAAVYKLMPGDHAHSGAGGGGGEDEAGGGGGHGHGGGSSSGRTLMGIERLIGDSMAFGGRTAVVWLTPGWPLAYGPELQLTDKQRLNLVLTAEALATGLRRANLALYMLDPVDNDKFDPDTQQYRGFLKGPDRLKEGAPAFFGMQVLAIHSGGWVRVSSDIAHTMDDVYADMALYYKASFPSEPTTRPNTLHLLDFRVAKNLIVRAPDVYWVEPK